MTTTMSSSYRVTGHDGRLLGIFPQGATAELRDLVQQHGLTSKNIEITVSYTPCPKHPAFEPDNCPACGTCIPMGT